MTSARASLARAVGMVCLAGALGILFGSSAMAGVIEVFHADSLGGPMSGLKKAFEGKHQGVTINLTPSTSRQLADRILKGETCDVFAPSSAPIANELVTKNAADWSVVFSANEMAVITAKGNPLGIQKIADLAKPGVSFVRITAEKDLGTGRTVEFLKRAATLEGKPELAQKIIDAAMAANSVPDTVRTVREGKANAGVVYFSAAVAAKNDLEIVRFPASVNLSDAIQNAAAVPHTAKNPKEAIEFVRFILSAEGQAILLQTGQPPVVPAIRKGKIPPELAN
ncbi:MAG: molybdate ABC transporter substrate-binding protein [Rhizobiales bacterium]|nr:molybdate ABC transporter substrate-binding protein [Hyphomicrobiales bacterium]